LLSCYATLGLFSVFGVRKKNPEKTLLPFSSIESFYVFKEEFTLQLWQASRRQ